ncbi:HAD-IB family hydrolase [Streptomyces sp. DSM 44917]|uniref:HAD-IB family hydrolase n=1 Tax=Streptomyces boetiae TaxID=3075541 RepID=A0ABU2L554_9ACTN|nr:HAD-IB family hydrolase [Streptomyces sp. DSM 44917]MDT0306695.1 HAD-IB family hydrolase [Streptomyces sp. DSM 44917]
MTTDLQDAAPAARPVVFSDVDETLIRVKSMFRFLRFYLARRGEPDSTYDRLAGELKAMAAVGNPRSEVNRAYYRFFAGEEATRLAAAGWEWYDREEAEPGGLYHPEVRRALAGHAALGQPVVLISGSFFACLEPIAAATNATWAIGTRPLIHRGVLTGSVLLPVIGAAKGRVAHAVAAVRGADLGDSTAYGDHISDLDLLDAVGHPVVVGDDPELTAHADRRGWRRMAVGQPGELEKV